MSWPPNDVIVLGAQKPLGNGCFCMMTSPLVRGGLSPKVPPSFPLLPFDVAHLMPVIQHDETTTESRATDAWHRGVASMTAIKSRLPVIRTAPRPARPATKRALKHPATATPRIAAPLPIAATSATAGVAGLGRQAIQLAYVATSSSHP